MYEAYWNFNCRPFDDGAEPKFYFPGSSHQTCLLKLRYLIEQRKGIGVLVGEHGTGKSFLSHVLQHDEQTSENCRFVRLVIPQLSADDLLRYFAAQIGIDNPSRLSMNETLSMLEQAFRDLATSGTHIVFAIDDAHQLDHGQLNILRLLLNLREEHRADFSILLTGRIELLAQIRSNHALDQRISVRSSLSPLDVEEVRDYINQRTLTAGNQRPIFHPTSAKTIWELSAGLPRRINQLCDLALLIGFADRLESLGPLEIQTASEEMSTVVA